MAGVSPSSPTFVVIRRFTQTAMVNDYQCIKNGWKNTSSKVKWLDRGSNLELYGIVCWDGVCIYFLVSLPFSRDIG